MLKLKTKIAGFYKIEAVNKNGAKRLLADWFPNLITNGGLDQIGVDTNYLDYCHVGSGSAVPAFTDTGLTSWIAQTNSVSNTSGITGASPYYSWYTKVYSFGLGVAAGNLSEVGVGWSASNGYLFSRALILDGVGNPTTITVLSDEYLYVTYMFRRYICEVDTGGTVDIAGTTYTFVGRCANADSISSWPAIFAYDSESSNQRILYVYDGAIGAIDAAPSGSNVYTSTYSISAYVLGNHYTDWRYSFSLIQGNLTNGISAMKAVVCGGQFQFGITPDIPKTSDDIMSLTFRASWDRA